LLRGESGRVSASQAGNKDIYGRLGAVDQIGGSGRRPPGCRFSGLGGQSWSRRWSQIMRCVRWGTSEFR